MSDPINGNGADQTGNGHSAFPMPDQVPAEMRALAEEIKTLETGILLARAQFAAQSGLTFNGERDEYRTLGYDAVITIQQYRDEYARGGIAGRVVDVMPDATWRGQPAFELIEDENPEVETPFEQAWIKLEKKHQIGSKLLRADKLSRLSTFSVLILGDGGQLDAELRKTTNPDRLLYLMPFLGGGGPANGSSRNQYRGADFGADCSIYAYDEDAASPRFGLPLTYTIKRTEIANPNFNRPVHWTRVIHLAEGLLDDEVYGQPALERIWNLLIDLRKVTGGGAEAFWLRANQGLHLDIDKDMASHDVATTIAALKEQSEAYKHQLTRWIRTRGVEVQTLGSDVANFDAPADAIITQIAGAKGIPKRILTGSEMGELASSQDRENFRDLIVGRQLQYAGPYIVRQLADRLIKYGYLPTPQKGPEEYDVLWPHIQVLTENEKVTGAAGMAGVNQTYGDVVFTDAEIRDKWFGWAPLTEEQRAEIDARAEEKAKQAQAAMDAGQPVPPGVDESSLDFNVDGDDPAAAADEKQKQDEKNPFLKAAAFNSKPPFVKKEKTEEEQKNAATKAEESTRATSGVQGHFKAGILNLHLKLDEKTRKDLEAKYALAQKAGFQGSQLEFFRQQLAMNVDPQADPAVKFSKATLASYTALRKTAMDKAPKPAEKKSEPEPKKEAKAVPPSKKKPTGSEKKPAGEKAEKPESESTDAAGLMPLFDPLKPDEREALEKGYRDALRNAYKGTKLEYFAEQLAQGTDSYVSFNGETLDAYRYHAKIRAAQEGKAYKFSSAQVQLPPVLADALLSFGRSLPAFDLCEEEGGLEDDAHITVKYGLHTNSAAEVRKALATYVGPIKFTLGKTAFFEGDGYDVLYVEVIPPDLSVLNARITNALDTTTSYHEYVPHAAVAYLKQGHAVRYAGLSSLEGMSATVGTARFSPAEGSDVDLPITGRAETGQFAQVDPRYAQPPMSDAREDLELLKILTLAIETGQTDIVHRIVGLGGQGSGNFGHEGRPGHVGGSGDDGDPASAKSTIDKILGPKSTRKKLTIDVLSKLKPSDRKSLHDAYSALANDENASFAERQSAKATVRAIQSIR